MQSDTFGFVQLLNKNKYVEHVLLRDLQSAIDGLSRDIGLRIAPEILILRYLAVLRSRAGLHRRWDWHNAITLEMDALNHICMWIPKNDPIFDGLLQIFEQSGRKGEIAQIAKRMIEIRKREISVMQSNKARKPRPRPFGRILDKLVDENPKISEHEALLAIKRMVGNGIVTGVAGGSIEIDDLETGSSETIPLDKLRSRLGHAKERFRKKASR